MTVLCNTSRCGGVRKTSDVDFAARAVLFLGRIFHSGLTLPIN